MQTLNAHSNYSLLTGTISIQELVDLAVENKSKYVVLTDTNGMYGLIQFAKYALEKNIKPILGAFIDDPNDPEIHTIILARNNHGYSRLCKIITKRKLQDEFSLNSIMNEDFSDLYFITSSLKFLTTIHIDDKVRKHLFVELISAKKMKRQTRELFNFAGSKGLKYCASHPVFMKSEDDFILHQVLTSIRENSTLSNLDESKLVDKEFIYMKPDEIKKIWKSLPQALKNTDIIAEDCNVDFKFGIPKFPKFSLPEGESSYSYLLKICFKGLEERYYPITDNVIKRLHLELDTIQELGSCDYFLIVWDIVREARRREIISIGRGSAANSIVAYCLGLTQVDPIDQNLYFERFLNKARTSPPDVDLDFSWKERDEIVRYVFDKYGYDKVAMISTTVTFRARSAFRETAKAFGISNEEISKYSRFIPWTSARNLTSLSEKFPEAKEIAFEDEPWTSIISVASRLANFPRHLSIHPSGIIVTPEPITNYVALEFAKNKGLGLIITQPDMYPIEDMGLVKIDLLSQRSLGVLRDTLNRIQEKD